MNMFIFMSNLHSIFTLDNYYEGRNSFICCFSVIFKGYGSVFKFYLFFSILMTFCGALEAIRLYRRVTNGPILFELLV